MTTSHQSRAALLQLIADGMRSASGDRLNAAQRDRIAGLLEHIAVDLLVPTTAEDANETLAAFAHDTDPRAGLHN